MYRMLCLVVLAAMLAGSPAGGASVYPKTGGAERPIPEEVLRFLKGLGITLASLPVIRPAERSAMQTLHFGSRADSVQNEVAALYLPSRNEILFDASFDLTDPVDLSYLVHELVHSHQTSAGTVTSGRCMGVLEAEAYAIQAAFLRHADRPRLALMFDLVGQLQGSCATVY